MNKGFLKSILALILVLSFSVVTFAGCGSRAGNSESADKKDDDVIISEKPDADGTENGNTTVDWVFTYTPDVNRWRAGLASALTQYSSGGDWERVRTAFVEGWNAGE